MSDRSGPLGNIAEYYAMKLAEHGNTPHGVDWNGDASQFLRFEQLSRIVDGTTRFTVNDLGCGYGAFLDFLAVRFGEFGYIGYDIAEEMIAAARGRSAGDGRAAFEVGAVPAESADYGIASGIFNVRLDCGEADWRAHIEATIETLDRTSTRGFAFNCLTSYSDAGKLQPHLYYADPCELFHLCKTRYSKDVALLHDYGLYEFTILVRKKL